MAVAVADKEVAHRGRELSFRFAADCAAPEAARDAVELAVGDLGGGARLTSGVLARALVAICVSDHGGVVHVDLTIGPERVLVEVSGAGDGFRLPPERGAINELCLTDADPRPSGWRSYLLDRLADDWGIDPEFETAWFEIDHASDSPRRMGTHRASALA
jgi:hypothetical protein